MFTKSKIEKAAKEQRLLNDPQGLIGKTAHAVKKNNGRKHKPSKVTDMFVKLRSRSESRFKEATKDELTSTR